MPSEQGGKEDDGRRRVQDDRELSEAGWEAQTAEQRTSRQKRSKNKS